MAYIGKSPTRGVRQRYIYTATGSETSISASDTAKEATGKALSFKDGAYVDVYKNGVLLEPNEAYNTNTANTIAGLSSLSSNDVIEVIVFDIFTTADAVSAYNGGTFSGTVTFDSDVTFEGSLNNRDVTWDKSDMALEFNNNVKAKFGADGGFEIYEAQYGGRIVETSGNIQIENHTDNGDITFVADNQNGGNATYMKLDGGNGEVQLWHAASGSSSVKLKTQSTGVDVTGVLTTDGITSSSTVDITGTNKLQLGDNGTYIHQSADGVLDLVADVELELNGALVDINSTDGNVDISATNGNVTLTGAVGNMTLTNNGTGDILLGNFKFDSDQTVGSGQDDYVLTYNHSTGKISLEEASGGGGDGTFTTDITAKTSDGAILKLQTSDGSVTYNNVLGAIEFSAPDEVSGTDANEVAASITALARNQFASDNNETDLVFKLGVSGAATEMMRMTHDGALQFPGNATIACQNNDDDILFTGRDGGTAITALTLDMSDNGALKPYRDIKMSTDGVIKPASNSDHLTLDSWTGIKLFSRASDGVAIHSTSTTPTLKFNRQSFGSNPQGVGLLEFNGKKQDSGGGNTADQKYGYISVVSSDTDTGEACGAMKFYLAKNDGLKNIMNLDTRRTDLPHDGAIILGTDIDIGFNGGNANGTITYLSVKDANPWSMPDDVTIYLPSCDGTVITTGNSDEFTDDIGAKTATGAKLKLMTSDMNVTNNDILGAIEFSAPNETEPGDGREVAASIVAEADATFNATTNKTDMVFKLGSSEAATEKVRFTHEGNIVLQDGGGIDFSAASGSAGGSTSALLDDYEEGTFTAAFTNFSGSATFSNAVYTKIGQMVFFTLHITGKSNTSDGDQITVSGFPFAVLGEHTAAVGTNASNSTPFGHGMVNTAEYMYFYSNTGGPYTYDMLAHTSGYFRIQGAYRIA
tara:strand:- start:189 stop:2966 length:2778 start_codon:yes stop_codon:yes gene_type:complete